ncbi:hypothetical protein BDW75DRAFT_240858 [Aspergillus navahoensis]
MIPQRPAVSDRLRNVICKKPAHPTTSATASSSWLAHKDRPYALPSFSRLVDEAYKHVLNATKLTTLFGTVTPIIHNGWTVNFNNNSVESFESQIRSVRHLTDFSINSRYTAHVAFVSSVSTIGTWKPIGMETSVPEAPMEAPDIVLE